MLCHLPKGDLHSESRIDFARICIVIGNWPITTRMNSKFYNWVWRLLWDVYAVSLWDLEYKRITFPHKSCLVSVWLLCVACLQCDRRRHRQPREAHARPPTEELQRSCPPAAVSAFHTSAETCRSVNHIFDTFIEGCANSGGHNNVWIQTVFKYRIVLIEYRIVLDHQIVLEHRIVLERWLVLKILIILEYLLGRNFGKIQLAYSGKESTGAS